MTNELLEIAKREAHALRTALANNTDFQKLQQVQRLIDIYEAAETSKPTIETPKVETQAVTSKKPNLPKTGSKASMVERIVADFLQERGYRASSGEILPIVQKAGIELSGQVPSKTLATILSNSARFNNVKGHGYGLAEWGLSLGIKEAPSLYSATPLDNTFN